MIGYDRYNNREAQEQQLNRIYALVGRYVNFFQPVMQLQEKRRRGALVRKVYDTARTPYQRLLACGLLGEEQRERLAEQYSRSNPAGLLREIKKVQERLWQLAQIRS